MGKGLSFIPSIQLGPTHNDSKDELIKDLQTLKDRYIDRYMRVTSNRAERLLKCCLKSIEYDFRSTGVQKVRDNLNRQETRALRGLIRNKVLVIPKTDKGDATVVIATKHYLELALKHLIDRTTYS